jgi:hypothetical protein
MTVLLEPLARRLDQSAGIAPTNTRMLRQVPQA